MPWLRGTWARIAAPKRRCRSRTDAVICNWKGIYFTASRSSNSRILFWFTYGILRSFFWLSNEILKFEFAALFAQNTQNPQNPQNSSVLFHMECDLYIIFSKLQTFENYSVFQDISNFALSCKICKLFLKIEGRESLVSRRSVKIWMGLLVENMMIKKTAVSFELVAVFRCPSARPHKTARGLARRASAGLK